MQFLHLHCQLCSLIVEIATFWPHFTTGPPNGLPYSLILEIAILWAYFVIGPPNGPLYRLIVEIATFRSHFVIGPPNGPHPGCLVKSAVFGLFCHSDTQWSTIQAEWWKVQFLVLISQWASKWHPYKADYLLTVWPYFSSGHEMGNLSFNIGGGLNGPLPFAGSL